MCSSVRTLSQSADVFSARVSTNRLQTLSLPFWTMQRTSPISIVLFSQLWPKTFAGGAQIP